VVNLVASVMMNGVCCIHSMQEEEKRQKEQQEALRKAINVEWQRQRLMELEHREMKLREEGKDAASIMADERRRLLMSSKIAASQQASSRSSATEMLEREKLEAQEGNSLPNQRNVPYYDIVMDRSRSAPTATRPRIYRERVPLVVGDATRSRVYCTNVSSLLDDDDDDDDDDGSDHDEEEFDEVKLI